MKVDVKLFAMVRERAGAGCVSLELAEGADVAAAMGALVEKMPRLRGHVEHVAYAVNLAYAPAERKLRDGDELAVIPPVSGG